MSRGERQEKCERLGEQNETRRKKKKREKERERERKEEGRIEG